MIDTQPNEFDLAEQLNLLVSHSFQNQKHQQQQEQLVTLVISEIGLLKTKVDKLEAKLDKIESNTVSIMGAVLSDFVGITTERKEAIEQAGTAFFADEQAVSEQHQTLNTVEEAALMLSEKLKVEVKPQLAPTHAKNVAKTRTALNNASICPATLSKGERVGFGLWAGRVLDQMLQRRVFAWYHPKMQPLLDELANFYLYEKNSERMT